MIGRTSTKQSKMLALNPVLIRETLNKVDKCMVRLQELQYTVAGGTKVISGVSLSPGSTKGHLKTSLRWKQESLIRSKHDVARRSPPSEEWKQMSLPAMLVDETVGEILQASQFAREIVSAVSKKKATKDPQTPLSQLSNQKVEPENTQLHDRRRKEKQMKLLSDSPPPQRARSRINFKVSPPKAAEFEKENNIKCLAKKVSTKNRACGSNSSKTVIFTNPLFLSTHFSRQKQFFKTEAPVISRNMGTQHKCLIKSPPEKASQFQGKVKNPSTVSISSSLARPTTTSLSKSSPKRWVPPFSSTRVATRFLASSALKSKKTEQKIDGVVNLRKCSSKGSLTSKLCRSFSPSRLATRFLSPLKRKKNAPQSDGIVNGVKQRPASSAKIPAPKN